MGARQSKRSVDITTGKEAVVATDGEGKVERIEDVDLSLKPQLNGDTTHEEIQISDKEKNMQQQDEQPENEKDTATEKEKEIILTPVENGNGEEAETPVSEEKTEKSPDSNKKTKKDKVKKILSRLSFNKKDKTKPAKKDLTNGDCEKVNEEAADNQETTQSESPVAETPKESSEAVEKTPDTPVTEPLTNGSSAPETPKEEVKENGESSKEETSPQEPEKSVVEEKPVDAEINGLSLNGLKIDVDIPKADDVPEIPKEAEVEVCVPPPIEEGLKANEVEAPPLPTTPPPSNLTMFVESTMATHLVNDTVLDEAPIVDVEISEPSVPIVEKQIENVAPELEESVPVVSDIVESNDPSLAPQEECSPDSNSIAVVSSIEINKDVVNDSGIGEIDQSASEKITEPSLPSPPSESLPEPLEDLSGSIPPPLVLSDEACPAPLDSLSPPPPPESCPESISETLPSDSLPPPYSESPDIPAPIESLPTETVPVAHTNGISEPVSPPPPLEIPSEYSAKPIEELVQVLPKEVTAQPQVKMVSDIIEAVSAPEPAVVESAPSDSPAAE